MTLMRSSEVVAEGRLWAAPPISGWRGEPLLSGRSDAHRRHVL